MKLYYFNVTNYQEIENRKPGTPGPKPVLEEIGPYVFREWHLKENIVWNDDNSTVTYQQSKRWKFIEEESADLDAIIVAPNIIAAVRKYSLEIEFYTQHCGNYGNLQYFHSFLAKIS